MNNVRNFNYRGDGDPYNDDEMKDLFISFQLQVNNEEYIYGTTYGIDCVNKNNPMIGAEGERASWNGDRWKSNQRDLFNIGVDTLNIQHSKWHYWGLQELSDKNRYKYIIPHPGFEFNLYFRINRQQDQICIVEASTIRDFNKIKFVLNRKVSNSNIPEDWICVPKQFVKTYNLQHNGLWLLDGEYCGLTQDEINKSKKDRAIEIAKKMFNK